MSINHATPGHPRQSLWLAIALTGLLSSLLFGLKLGGRRASDPSPHALQKVGAPAVAAASGSMKPRFAVVLINRHPINPWRIAANQKVKELVQYCFGPGDVLVLIHVTGSFAPESNARMRVEFPTLPPELLVGGQLRIPGNVPERNRLQATLNGDWQAVRRYQEAVDQALDADTAALTLGQHAGDPIEVDAPLAYALRLLKEAPEDHQKFILFFGPLFQMAGVGRPRFGFTPPPDLVLTDVQFQNLFAARETDSMFEAYRTSVIGSLAHCGISISPQAIQDRAMSAALGPTGILPPSPVPKQMPRVPGL
jgi:hypothetical protein